MWDQWWEPGFWVGEAPEKFIFNGIAIFAHLCIGTIPSPATRIIGIIPKQS